MTPRSSAPLLRRAGPDFQLERASAAPVCGVDEAGRGPWAGPVCAAAVILDPLDLPAEVDDSKRLSARVRERVEADVKRRAVAWAVAWASPEEIDALNILQATGLAMRRAVDFLTVRPASVLVDGNRAFDFGRPTLAVIGGDARSQSIAAASVLAKTARDRLMASLEAVYPGYGFGQHRGYGVRAHQAALDRLGPCPLHRRSFAPVRDAMARGLVAEAGSGR